MVQLKKKSLVLIAITSHDPNPPSRQSSFDEEIFRFRQVANSREGISPSGQLRLLDIIDELSAESAQLREEVAELKEDIFQMMNNGFAKDHYLEEAKKARQEVASQSLLIERLKEALLKIHAFVYLSDTDWRGHSHQMINIAEEALALIPQKDVE